MAACECAGWFTVKGSSLYGAQPLSDIKIVIAIFLAVSRIGNPFLNTSLLELVDFSDDPLLGIESEFDSIAHL